MATLSAGTVTRRRDPGANLARWLSIPRRRAASATDKLQLSLAALWILDGVLQLQPAMFTQRFPQEVILPAAQGQPALISAPIHQAATLIAAAPATFNFGFAAIQLAIGVGLLFRRPVKAAIVVSILWALNVWILGEGLGGLLAGGATLWTGAPGAAVLYLMLAASAWPSRERPSEWLALGWLAVWLGGSALQLVPGEASTGALRQIALANVSGGPHWLVEADRAFATSLAASGPSVITLLVALQVFVAVAALDRGGVRVVGRMIGIALALGFWVFGQGLGGYWTGLATDPNSGPLLVLMALALPSAVPQRALAALSARLRGHHGERAEARPEAERAATAERREATGSSAWRWRAPAASRG